MARKTLPSRDLLHQLLRYDPDTGEFSWLPRPREMFSDDGHWKMWNIQNAGKNAGSLTASGYLRIGKSGFRAQRLAWLLVHGEPVPDVIDHIDNDRLNNRISNLRAVTDAENGWNAKIWSNNRSGVKGVSLSRGAYRASICLHGKNYELGVFSTLEEAAEARRKAASRLHGEFARHE